MAKFHSKVLDGVTAALREHLDEALTDTLHEALEAYGEALSDSGMAWTTRTQRVDGARFFIEWLEGRYRQQRELAVVGGTEHQ